MLDSSAVEAVFGVSTPEAVQVLSDAEGDIIPEEEVEIDQWGPSQALVLWEDLGEPVEITPKVIFFYLVTVSIFSTAADFFFGRCIAWGWY